MMTIGYKGLDELRTALARHPQIVNTEIKNYLVRAKAEIQKVYTKAPWRVGQAGGGVPVAQVNGGNLSRKGTGIEVSPYSITFYVDDAVEYGKYVHGRNFGERNARTGVMSRPWLYNAGNVAQKSIELLQDKMLKNIADNIIK